MGGELFCRGKKKNAHVGCGHSGHNQRSLSANFFFGYISSSQRVSPPFFTKHLLAREKHMDPRGSIAPPDGSIGFLSTLVTNSQNSRNRGESQ